MHINLKAIFKASTYSLEAFLSPSQDSKGGNYQRLSLSLFFFFIFFYFFPPLKQIIMMWKKQKINIYKKLAVQV